MTLELKPLYPLFLSFIFSWGQPIYAQENQNFRLIDTIFEDIDVGAPGYMCAVIKEGAFLWEKGYGAANLEHSTPISKSTSFNIASLSKQFTAAAVALLILDGQLDLEDPVSDYLNDFPFAEDDMRIKHLVYMTSGINDYYYNPAPNNTDWSSLHFFNVDSAIAASYGSGELMYKPGSQWSYSNINYMLMTKIVEKVRGVSFSQFLKQRIFDPLEMYNTLVNDDIFTVIPNRALGYNHRDADNTGWMVENGYLPEAGQGYLQIHRNAAHYGGSGIYTTMEDFKKWMGNYSNRSLGGDAFYNLMHKTMTFDHDKSNDAFGLVLDTYDDKDIVWYEGGDWGYSSFMVRFIAADISLVCFSNLGTGNARSKVWAIYDILKDRGLFD